jgi:hypothetical protein
MKDGQVGDASGLSAGQSVSMVYVLRLIYASAKKVGRVLLAIIPFANRSVFQVKVFVCSQTSVIVFTDGRVYLVSWHTLNLVV